jgi:hypothetical protein
MTKTSLTGIQVSTRISAFPINNESYEIRKLFCFLYKKDRCMCVPLQYMEQQTKKLCRLVRPQNNNNK